MKEQDPTVIGITGMKRSGTTTQFNIVRCACRLAGYDVWSGGPAPDALSAIEKGDADVYVVKEHRWHEALARACTYVFTAERDREEVKRSMEDFRGWRPDDEQIAQWETWLEKWRTASAYVNYHMMYWTLDEHPCSTIYSHLSVLQVNADYDDVVECVTRSMRAPDEERQDENSLVFRDHYTSRDPDELINRMR